MEYIVVVASTYKQARFFSRMKESLYDIGIDIFIITTQYSAYSFLKKRKINTIIPSAKFGQNEQCDNVDFFEPHTGRLSEHKCIALYKSSKYIVRNFFENNRVKGVFIFNGENAEQKAVAEIAREYKKPVLFFEISNIPGKVFVDKLGVNANSKLYTSVHILDKYPDCHLEYENWKKIYLECKRAQSVIPQQRSKFSDISIKNLYDVYGVFCNDCCFDKSYIVKKASIVVRNFFSRFQYSRFDYSKGGYIFFPLQVSYDSQILINSDISILDALEYAIKQAKDKNKVLIVKPHPQEADDYILSKLKKLQKKNGFYIVNDNVIKIIESADEVITINSTVGLEALILGKKVDVLGKAIYKNFTESQLKKYICHYLVDIDFFDLNPITIDKVYVLFSRLLEDELK